MKALKSNCIFGIVIGLLIVAAGLYLAFGFSGSYIGNDSGTAEFGADFYTYQYRATRNAATNVENLGLVHQGRRAVRIPRSSDRRRTKSGSPSRRWLRAP